MKWSYGCAQALWIEKTATQMWKLLPEIKQIEIQSHLNNKFSNAHKNVINNNATLKMLVVNS